MNRQFEFDSNLISRYDVQGPRYTSYPSAAEFTEGFGVDDYARAVKKNNGLAKPPSLSLYVHVPFCRTLCYYCGCNKIVTRHPEKFDPYLDRLLHEAAIQATIVDTSRQVEQLHFGGGTPTYLDTGQFERLLKGLKQQFSFADNIQSSIEIDPRTVDTQYINTLRRLGFNRISLGVQDFDAQVQQSVNRIQPLDMVADVVQTARDADFDSISFDLIYGLPFQNVASFGRTLEQVISLAPDRLAVYNYAHLPQRFRAQRLIDDKTLPSAVEKLALLELTMAMLDEAGYQYIGMDHFAKPVDSLAVAMRDGSLQRNFQGYSTHAACDLLGLGVSAISNPVGAFAQNTRDIRTWEASIDAGALAIDRGLTMDQDDRIRAAVIMQIMCRSELKISEIEHDWQIDFADYFESEMQSLTGLAEDGLIEANPCGFTVTPRGRLLLRIVAMMFDRYRARPTETRFSKVI